MSKLKHAKDLTTLIVEVLPVGVCLTSIKGEIIYLNPKAEEIFGFDKDELLGHSIENLIPGKYRKTHKKHRENYIINPKKTAMSDGRILDGLRKNGENIKLQIGLTPLNDEYTLVSFIESTNKIIKPSVSNDPLTGLSNRQLFNEYSEKFCKLAIRNKSSISILFIDLDNFKSVNDQFGHDLGNLVLCEVADLLRNAVRENDIIARIGGDEFLMCLYGVENLTNLKKISDTLIGKICALRNIDGKVIDIGASIGAAFTHPLKEILISDMIDAADKLMYKAKHAGKRVAIVSQV